MIAFGYYGGKNSKLGFILPQLVTPHRMYVELCGGSAAVLLNKPQAKIEVLNDRAGDVANFWQVLRETPDELIYAINHSPPGEAEFKRNLTAPPTADPVERARRFYVIIQQSFSCLPKARSHSFSKATVYAGGRHRLQSVADRMRDVVVENTDAARLMARCFGRKMPILFYADPPYTTDSRRQKNTYLCEEFDHTAFLDAVLDAPDHCKFAISGYANPLYDDRLAKWHRVEFDTLSQAAPVKNKEVDRRTEVLWRNYPLPTEKPSILTPAPFIANPIDAGMTSFAELNTKKDDGDPLITLENLADMNEILAIRVENERRAHKHAEKKSHTTR